MNFLKVLWQVFLEGWKTWALHPIDETISIIPPTMPPEPSTMPTVPPEAPKYLWDNTLQVKHSVRLICDSEGLSLEQKNTLCATIACESQFNTKAINQNKDRNGKIFSTDYGLGQINDYWHIGPGKDFPSVEYVLNNPEAVVRWMCKMWKANKRTLWVCYSRALYKAYL